jgi:hypothetical protein
MGAQSFILRKRAKSASNAFTLAQEDAIEEYGNDIYNGTISTCHSFKDITKEFKRSGLSAIDFSHSMVNDMNKRDCYVICEVEPKVNNNKIKSVVENAVVKGTSKWELQYNVYTGMNDRQLKSFKTKTDAVKYAREYTEKTQNTTFVRMEKTLINQNANVACIKYKRSTSEQEGQYVFFGMAAC